jgi:hypothetical protein
MPKHPAADVLGTVVEQSRQRYLASREEAQNQVHRGHPDAADVHARLAQAEATVLATLVTASTTVLR